MNGPIVKIASSSNTFTQIKVPPFHTRKEFFLNIKPVLNRI